MITIVSREDVVQTTDQLIIAGLPDIKVIDMNLIVWHDQNEKVSKFLYSPPSALFFTDNATQTLNIKLTAARKSNGDPRYAILGYSTKKKKRKNQPDPINELFDRIDYRKKNGGFEPLNQRHKFPILDSNPTITDHVEEIRYTLKLDRDNRDTYITVIVMDMEDNSIIDCDPQAENGTKT